MAITRPQKLRIMARCLADERTVDKAYRGQPMRPTTHERIRLAAKELRLPAPLPLNAGG